MSAISNLRAALKARIEEAKALTAERDRLREERDRANADCEIVLQSKQEMFEIASAQIATLRGLLKRAVPAVRFARDFGSKEGSPIDMLASEIESALEK